jgi:F-type H+-transporting ATPase subunit alpha
MGLLKNIPVNKIKAFETEYLEYLSLKHKDVLEEISKGVINNEITSVLEKAAAELSAKYHQN